MRSKPTAADYPSGTIPTVTTSAACDLGRCATCKGEVLSLLAPVGAKCQHACHQRPGVAA